MIDDKKKSIKNSSSGWQSTQPALEANINGGRDSGCQRIYNSPTEIEAETVVNEDKRRNEKQCDCCGRCRMDAGRGVQVKTEVKSI